MSGPEQVAVVLFGTVAECNQALYDYAVSVWERHDFGNGSTLGPDFKIEPIGDIVRVRAAWTIATWAGDGSDDGHELTVELVLELGDAGVVVETGVTAFLDPATAGYQAGLNVLHRTRSGLLDLTAALATARAEIAAFKDLDDFAAALGFRAIW